MRWRHHLKTSPLRLVTIACVAGISFAVVWALPSIVNVDFLRPQIIDELQDLTGTTVSIKHIRVRLLPRPGLLATDLTFTDPTDTHHPLLRVNRVGLRFYGRPLLTFRLDIRHITLNSPLFNVRRESTGIIGWAGVLQHRTVSNAATMYPLEAITVHGGQVDFTDLTPSPDLHLSLRMIELTYDVLLGNASLDARDPTMGDGSKILLTYRKNSLTPMHLLFGRISTHFLTPYFPAAHAWLDGTLDMEGVGRAPTIGALPTELTLDVTRWQTQPLRPIELDGRISISTETLRLNFHTKGADPESVVDIKSPWPNKPVTIRASLDNLSPEIAHQLTISSWLSRLRGHGHAMVIWKFRPNAARPLWQATASGFYLEGTGFQLQRAVCSNDPTELHLHVEAVNSEGPVQVEWVSPAQNATSSLIVNVSSISVRSVLQTLSLSTAATIAPITDRSRHFEPTGYLDLILESGHLESTLTPSEDFSIDRLKLKVEGSSLEASGAVDLTATPPHLLIKGAYHQWPVERVINHFFSGPPILSGTGEMLFDIQAGLGPESVKTLTGQVTVRLTRGIFYEFKNVYRIESLINFSNYFKLRLPDVGAKGIAFDDLEGTLNLNHGLLTTKDLFLSSPDIKIAAHGAVDLPASRLDMNVEFQALRFVEDVITHLPGLHWIFKEGHKIILPIPIHLKGRFNDISVS